MLRAMFLTAALLATPVWAGQPENEALALANAARAQAGCGPLRMDARLKAAAAVHAQAMARQDFFSHRGKDGSNFGQRIRAQGYRYRAAAENIAAGHAEATATMQQWLNSPGHRKNLLNCRYTATGIAMAFQANDRPLRGQKYAFSYYWVQDFASQ